MLKTPSLHKYLLLCVSVSVVGDSEESLALLLILWDRLAWASW